MLTNNPNMHDSAAAVTSTSGRPLLSLAILFTAGVCFSAYILATLTFVSTANAQIFDDDYIDSQSGLAGTISLGLASDRVHRGRNLHDGTSFQPAGEVSFGSHAWKVYLRIFSHISAEGGRTRTAGAAPFEATDANGNTVTAAQISKSFVEVDGDIGFEMDFELFTLDFGNRWYYYSSDAAHVADTSEIYTKLAFNVPLNPHVFVAYDWDEYDGFYYETGISQPLPISILQEETIITPFATVGFSNGLNDEESRYYAESGVAYWDVGVKGKVPVSQDWSIQPEIHYTDAEDEAANNEFWFGFNIVGDFG